MRNVLVGNKHSVKWPDADHQKFKKMVDECRGFRGFASLFTDAPENFDRTVSRIYGTGVSHPDTYKTIMQKVKPQTAA